MSDLREKYADMIHACRSDGLTLDIDLADAVLAVRDDEVERLQAELGRHQEQIETYYAASQEWLRVEAENHVLRARLAAVEEMAEWWSRNDGLSLYGTASHDHARQVRAALASVPEPSASEPVEAWHETPGDVEYPEPKWKPITSEAASDAGREAGER